MAEKFVHSNFAVTTLTEAIGPDDVNLQINVDDVPRFPTLVSGAKFTLVLADSDDITEIVYVTALSSGGVATCERGAEGTVAQSWLAGTLARHTFTAASIIGAAGLRPKGAWDSVVQYEPGDVVVHDDVSFIAVVTNIGSTPSDSNEDWQIIYQPPGAASTALNWVGRWSNSTEYTQGQVVEYHGRLWRANATNTNSAPTVVNTNWTHLAKWSGSASHEAVLAFTGTNNYTVTIPANEAPTAYYDGMKVVGRFANANNANATLAINALSATPLRFKAGVELGSGDIIPGELYEFTYVAATSEFISKQSAGIGNELTQLAALVSAVQVVPPGTIVAYGGASAPAGWLICDGAEFSRTGPTAALFAAIGTIYGVGNGTTTANLPDLRGRVPTMVPMASGRLVAGYTGGLVGLSLGDAGGEFNHTLTAVELAAHAHGINDPGHSHGVSDPTHGHGYSVPDSPYTVNAGVQANVWQASLNGSAGTAGAGTGISIQGAGTGISIQNAGSDAPHNNLQPLLLVNMIIKI